VSYADFDKNSRFIDMIHGRSDAEAYKTTSRGELSPFWTKLAKIYPCCGAIPVPDQMPARMFIGQKVHLQDTAAAAWTEHGCMKENPSSCTTYSVQRLSRFGRRSSTRCVR
jgi:hypothetical protein